MSLDLDPIKARAEAATEGPWAPQFWRGQNQNGDYGEPMIFYNDGETLSYLSAPNADVDFIAHARTDVPALVAEVERLRGRIEALHPREVIAAHEGYEEDAWCPECRSRYPCQTIRALEGK